MEHHTFIKDIELCDHFESIQEDSIFDSLKKKAENGPKQHEEGVNIAAINRLSAFIDEVNAQQGKKIIAKWKADNVQIYDPQEMIAQWEN